MLTFDLRTIFVFCAAAFLYGGLLPAQARQWALLVGSIIAIYWLQPFLPIRFGDYILPTAAIALTAVTWWLTRRRDDPAQQATYREDRITLAVMVALVLGMSLMRFVAADWRLTASRPPQPLLVVLALAGVGTVVVGVDWPLHQRFRRQHVLTGGILLMTALFVLLKSRPLAVGASRWWRAQTGQLTSEAAAVDLTWLGFSYIAFRLIHTLRDRQTGLLPVLSLREYVTYVLFFPALTAGPIDRAQHFTAALRTVPQKAGLDATRFTEGLARVGVGLFKKFVIADSLAQGMALNSANASLVNATPALWMLLYGYALRLYFDFGGYSDIAIGIGILFGIKLPENFRRPYLQTNLTAFWQSWHITLSDWARFYVFTPLSRWLLRQKPRPAPTLIVLTAQLATMIVIGLWHGVSGNFFLWGLWHGVGLFIHKQWSDRTRRWYRRLQTRPFSRRLWATVAWFITFHYVVIGWVWFVLPQPAQAARTVGRLFGIGW